MEFIVIDSDIYEYMILYADIVIKMNDLIIDNCMIYGNIWN